MPYSSLRIPQAASPRDRGNVFEEQERMGREIGKKMSCIARAGAP